MSKECIIDKFSINAEHISTLAAAEWDGAVWARGHEQFFVTPIDNNIISTHVNGVFFASSFFFCVLYLLGFNDFKVLKKLITQNTVEYQGLNVNGIRKFDY